MWSIYILYKIYSLYYVKSLLSTYNIYWIYWSYNAYESIIPNTRFICVHYIFYIKYSLYYTMGYVKILLDAYNYILNILVI